MRILFQSPSAGVDGVGNQIRLLMGELASRGHQTVFSANPHEDLAGVDVVQLQMINQGLTIGFYRNCMRQARPYVVKCVWHQFHNAVNNEVANIARHAHALTVEAEAERQEVVGFLRSELSEPAVEAVDAKTTLMRPAVAAVFRRTTKFAERVGVHTNGRYQHLKNAADVIKACRRLGLPVVTAGPVADRQYFDYCRSLAHGSVLDVMDNAALNAIYNQSRVYVCPSLREINSTSLAEAVACGCQVVSSTAHMSNGLYNSNGYRVYTQGDFADLVRAIDAAYHDQSGEQGNDFWRGPRLAQEYEAIYVRAVSSRIQML